MERIIMEVKAGIADKWKQASHRMKKQAVKAVEQVLGASEDSHNIFEKKHHPPLSEDDLRFYDNIQIDLSEYTFNRDEANER